MPTTNPVPSTDPTDLLFNAGKLDEVVNGASASYTDRLGVSRRSLSGIDAAADNVLNAIGYSVPVAYASGISLTLTSQTVDYNGVIYAPKSSALPFTTSSWGVDSAKFRAVQITDADLITYTPAGTGAVATTVQSKLREFVSVKDFGAACDGVTNDWDAVQRAQEFLKENGGGTLYFPGWCYIEQPFYFCGSINNGWAYNPNYPNPYQPMITWASDGQHGIRVGMTSGDVLRFSNPNTSENLTYNVGFRDFVIDCNQKNVTAINGTHYSGLAGANHFTQVDNLLIQGIEGPQAIGFDFGTIADSKVKGLCVQGWGTGPYAGARLNKTDVQLIDCHFLYCINSIVIGTLSEACIQMFGGSLRSPKIRNIYWEAIGTDYKSSASVISGAFIGETNVSAASTHGPLMGAANPAQLDVGTVTFVGCTFDNWTTSTNLANITWGGQFTFIGNNHWAAATGNKSIKFGQYCKVFWQNNGANLIDPASDALALGNVNRFLDGLASMKGIGTGGARAFNAGVSFPATSIAVTDPNTLDDYEEGTWAPVLTFDNPGDLSISYLRNAGRYQKIGNTVYVSFTIVTSSFTHSTASGGMRIAGLPFVIATGSDNYASVGMQFEGITKSGYTAFTVDSAPGGSYVVVFGSGSGVAISAVTAADTPTGSRKILQGQFQYRV